MQKKIFPIIAHIVAWLFFLVLPFGFIYEDENLRLEAMLLSPYYWLFSLSYGLLFYINFFFLIPKLYLKGLHRSYMLALLLLFIIFYFQKPFYYMFKGYFEAKNLEVSPTTPLKIDTMSCILFIIVVCSGLAIQVIGEWRASEKRALMAEADKANAELSFLKAQVNPHFLFNTLNNIYSLSLDQHPDTSDSILKLSYIMRYITNEATKDLILLKKEIYSIQDYIDLQQLRLDTNITIDFEVIGNPENKQVAPLILITYIENAFKYGISSREEASIIIKLTIMENEVVFYCRNKIFSGIREAESTGIGLANTKQRLKYLYQDKQKLVITNEDGFYTVEQTLPIHNLVSPSPKLSNSEPNMAINRG
jgi:two-component system LytT family sensor kinase